MSWNEALNNNLYNFQKLDIFLSNLEQRGKIQAEYIWIGGEGELRSKTRTLNSKPNSPDEIPEWNYDGSSTKQAPGDDSEVIIKPRAIFADPFRRGDNILLMCDTYSPSGDPLPSNSRAKAKIIFDQCLEQKPWFGIEQEFVLTHPKDHSKMYGWPSQGFPAPQGPYYCSVGAGNAIGRELIEAHYRCCLHAGIQISGCNAEVMCSQWEYQVGPVEGIAIGDQLYVSRWILHRLGEIFNIGISFDPKPVTGDWNGSGGHVNFSTEPMRKEGGLKLIEEAMEKLSKKHKEHIAVYGAGNEKRLTGKHETSSMEKFSWGVANRAASVRLPRDTQRDGKGYFEDRRPASNLDPYLVCSMLVKTTCLDK